MFEVDFLNGLGGFLLGKFSLFLRNISTRGLKNVLGWTSLDFKVYLNDFVYLPSEGSLTRICSQL